MSSYDDQANRRADSSSDPDAAAGSTGCVPGALASKRILLAEDNEDARRAFSARLAQMGLEVATASDGQEACAQALAALSEGRPFDWILMDMQMPIVDGFEATRRLRTQGYDRPVIAMTAYATSEDREECIRFGCDEHISKPIDWDQLATLLAAHP
jgi:CheY-like chemotaxis protein